MKKKTGVHFLKYLHDKGFISGQSNNFCSRELYDLEEGFIDNITFVPFDHENIALFCDPNYFSVENPYTPYLGPYSVKRRCLYGRDTHEYVLEYGEKFWETYLNQKKILRLSFQDAHEGTMEVVSYLDKKLYDLLNNFQKKQWLNDTAILFVSDHGNNMIGFYSIFSVNDFVIEKTLPTLFLMLPNNYLKETQRINLEHNKNSMISPYDIHNTILDLLDVDRKYNSKNGTSLLEKVNSEERNCDYFSFDMDKIWCRCAD